MSVATIGLLSGLKMTPDGRVFGVDAELLRTQDGYRGVVRGLPLDLHASPGHVFGHVGIQPVDLHVTYEADELLARGMFAGRLGRLELGPDHLKCSLGNCAYSLRRASETSPLEGERACTTSRDWLVPYVIPAHVDLPPAFSRLRPERQAMLLALMLGGTPYRERMERTNVADEENPRAPRTRPVQVIIRPRPLRR